MIVTKYVCDRCGKEIKNKNEIYKAEVSEGLGEPALSCAHDSFHLCKDCVKILLTWIVNGEKEKKYYGK